MAHQEEIQHHIMKKMNPAILALSESRLISEIEDNEVNVPGYSVVRYDSENRSTGGVYIYRVSQNNFVSLKGHIPEGILKRLFL